MKAYRIRYLNIKSSERDGHRISFIAFIGFSKVSILLMEVLCIPNIPDVLRFLASTNKIVMFTS